MLTHQHILQVQGIDGIALPTLNADLEGMAAKVESIKNTFDTLQTTVTGLITSLTDVQTKIDSITSMKDQIPAADVTALSTGVDLLDSNMQDFQCSNGQSFNAGCYIKHAGFGRYQTAVRWFCTA